MNSDKEIDYVARHYKHDAFSKSRAWRHMGIGRRFKLRYSHVASIAVLVSLSVVASIVIRNNYVERENRETVQTEQSAVSAPHSDLITAIEFDNAPLPDVIKAIESTYGVELGNIPQDAAKYRLTLYYEGDVENLVSTINDILELDIEVL